MKAITDHHALCKTIIEIVRETGEFIRNEKLKFSATSDVELKGHSNFVTYVDKMSEKKLVDELGRLIPDSGFVVEEGTSDKIGEHYNWIIDPLDGTTNFIHGLPPHSISVALTQKDEVIIGVVYEIVSGEMFYSYKGGAAYLNGTKIAVSQSCEHQQALIATGFPYHDFDRIDNYMKAMNEMIRKTSGLRRLGSAAIDLCYVACGRFDAFWEYALNPWDVAAGAFIVQQAGGIVTNFKGEPNFSSGKEIIASNKLYYDKFYEIVNKYLG
jgi:myo-inositol-1(or 4)-monophosphatase